MLDIKDRHTSEAGNIILTIGASPGTSPNPTLRMLRVARCTGRLQARCRAVPRVAGPPVVSGLSVAVEVAGGHGRGPRELSHPVVALVVRRPLLAFGTTVDHGLH
jgi:hypothetical protein